MRTAVNAAKIMLRIGAPRFSLKSALLVASIAASGVFPLSAHAIPIAVSNPGFENLAGLTPNATNFNDENRFDFNAPSYSGWFETSPTFVSNNLSNIGPINVDRADITIETPFGDSVVNTATVSDAGDNGDEDEDPDANFPKMALYLDNNGRVNQTTAHVISASDTSFTLAVDVGNDASNGGGGLGYRGYNFSLYAFDSGTNSYTLLKTASSTLAADHPLNNSWVLGKTLTLVPSDVVNWSTVAVGKRLGISLYQNGNVGNRAVFYDNVTLSYVPEPTALYSLAMGALGVLLRRSRRAIKV